MLFKIITNIISSFIVKLDLIIETKNIFFSIICYSVGEEIIHIYPTPPLGQDMTQGQFLSEV